MSAVVIRESRSQALLRLSGSAAFVAVSVWLLASPNDLSPFRAEYVEFAGWIGVIFFGLMILRFAWAVVSPGKLAISPSGLEQDLGWRRKRWLWADIKDVVLVRSVMTTCMVRPRSGLPVRLFGWTASAKELKRAIDHARLAANP